MNLKLNFTEDATGFIDFLSSFKKISETLLLEIDTENQKFLAKSSSGKSDSSSIDSTRYSQLPFAACGVSIVPQANQEVEIPARIYVGILNRLTKLISIVSEANRRVRDNEGASFSLTVSYTDMSIADLTGAKVNVSGAVSMLVKTSKLAGNKGLSSTMACTDLNKNTMRLTTDQQFDEAIFYLDPDTKYSFVVEPDSLESIFKMMEIYKTTGSNENEIVVNITDKRISISNETLKGQKTSESFNEVIFEGEINDCYVNQSICVSKDAFKKNVDKKSPVTLSIGTSKKGVIDRLCIEDGEDESQVLSKVVLLRIMHPED